MKYIAKFKEKLLLKLKNWDTDSRLKNLSVTFNNGNNAGLLYPIQVFQLVCFKVYQKEYDWLRIYSVSINTHHEDGVVISISTRYPGILIGRKGEKIDKVMHLCEKVFGRHVDIDLVEVKSDENEPLPNY